MLNAASLAGPTGGSSLRLGEAPRVGIVGMGHVGRAMRRLFPTATCFDVSGESATRSELNTCDVALVCVPTPEGPGGTCDTSAVEEVVAWLRTPHVVLRSTVPPGTTNMLREQYGRPLVFWPEYFGEWTHAAAFERTVEGWPAIILGGHRSETSVLLPWLSRVFGAERTYRQTDATTAELTKYMENAWLASQVVFANEFAAVAKAVGSDYWELRELWALDPRVSRAHTALSDPIGGFGGKCLPKDLAAIVASSTQQGHRPEFLEAIQASNQRFRSPEHD